MNLLKVALTLIALPLVFTLSGCTAWCDGITQGGTRSMDGFCGGYLRNEQKLASERAQQYGYSGGNNSSSDNLNTYMLLQMQQQNIQNNINKLTAPRYTEPTPIVRGNTQPFQQPAPQLPIQNPSINCVPTGGGGFRCQ